LDAGDLGAEHARIILQTMKALPGKLDEQTRQDCETTLVTAGAGHDPRELDIIAQHLQTVIDPDGKLDEPRDPASRAELNFGVRNHSTGLTPISGRMDDVGVDTIRKAIDELSAPHPAGDGVPDPRSAATRRAQALIEALDHSLAAGTLPSSGGQRPQLTVTVAWDSIYGQFLAGSAGTDTGTPLTVAKLRLLACDAEIIPAILGGRGEVLDIGRAARTFPPKIRRAIALRDKGCVWDGCDRPPSWCHAHHITWWEKDLGDTNFSNGALLCSYHHREIHKAQWTLRMGTDGHPELIPPTWIDPHQTPRRNTLHHHPARTTPPGHSP